jgi:hypothetical protein
MFPPYAKKEVVFEFLRNIRYLCIRTHANEPGHAMPLLQDCFPAWKRLRKLELKVDSGWRRASQPLTNIISEAVDVNGEGELMTGHEKEISGIEQIWGWIWGVTNGDGVLCWRERR